MKTNGDELTRRRFLERAGMGAAALGALAWSNPVREKGTRDRWPGSAPASLPLQLARNESPYGPFPSAVEALRFAQGLAHRYPVLEPVDLEAALSKRHGVAREQVMLGCGSVEILKIATDAFTSASLRPVVAEPTFEAVVSYAPLRHTMPVKVPVTADFRHDLGRMTLAAKAEAGLIFLCNPGNPTGTLMDKVEVDQFIRNVPESVVVLADEAYADYVDHPKFESCIRYVREGRPNVIVSRTFSKVFGMAGMRLGYAIGSTALVARMRPYRLWNNVNQLVAAAATAALADEDSIGRVRRMNREVREQFCDELGRMGLGYIPSETNFVTVHLGRPAEPVIRRLRERRVLVGRPFASIPRHVRISLGTTAEMKLFFEHFKAVLNERGS